MYLCKCNSFLLLLFDCISDQRKPDRQALPMLHLWGLEAQSAAKLWISKRRCLVQPFGGIDLSVKDRLFRSYWISGLCSPAQAQAHHKQDYCPGVANTERVVQHLAIRCVMSTMSYILSVWLILNLDFSLSWFSVFASLENLTLIFKNHPRHMEGQLCGGRDGRHLEDRMCLDVSDETSPSHSFVSFLVC